MPRNDEGNGNSDGSEQQLPRPQTALKEERHSREQGGQDAAVCLRTEMQDDARHEAAHATEQTEIGKECLLENTGKTHQPTTYTRGKANEYPHHQDAVLLMSAAMGAVVVLIEEVYHEGCTYQGDACPKPLTPVFIPHQEGDKLCKQD